MLFSKHSKGSLKCQRFFFITAHKRSYHNDVLAWCFHLYPIICEFSVFKSENISLSNEDRPGLLYTFCPSLLHFRYLPCPSFVVKVTSFSSYWTKFRINGCVFLMSLLTLLISIINMSWFQQTKHLTILCLFARHATLNAGRNRTLTYLSK